MQLDAPEYGCAGESCAPCAAPEHYQAICVAGACALGACDEGYQDCDGTTGNGCETDVASTQEHCGSCLTSCLGPHTVAAETSCASGGCLLTCEQGYDDCNTSSDDGCEAELAGDPAHCGTCDHPCQANEICQQGSCVKDDPTLAWLATQQGGWCLDDHTKLVNLCGKVSSCSYTLCGDLDDEQPSTGDPATSPNCYPDLGHEHERAVPFCCDPAYFRAYPDGLAVDIGFHYDGISPGHLLALGGDTPGDTIDLSLDTAGTLSAVMFDGAVLTVPLAAGTHLVSARVTGVEIALHVDGVLVGGGSGATEPAQLVAADGPGFIIGSRISYWWQEQTTLRFAPFLVHLRSSVSDPSVFSLSEAISPMPSTIVLFDAQGVAGNAWNATSGAGVGYAISKDVGGADGAWVDDVWSSCL